MPESPHDRTTNNGEPQAGGSRRRGDVLENAILSAAWEELQETGYSKLTMEAVAVRAKTNKTAVYRRWPNKGKLIIASIIKYMPKPSLEAPDTGSLRDRYRHDDYFAQRRTARRDRVWRAAGTSRHPSYRLGSA